MSSRNIAITFGVIVIIVLGVFATNSDFFQGDLFKSKKTSCPKLKEQCDAGNQRACRGYQKSCLGSAASSGTPSSDNESFTPPSQVSEEPQAVASTQLVFSPASGLASILTNGNVRIYGFTATAIGGDVMLPALNFPLHWNLGDASDTMGEFNLSRGTILPPAVNIMTVSGVDAETTDITGFNISGDETLTVTWLTPEIITEGTSITYYLSATVSGVSVGNSVTTSLTNASELAPLTLAF